MWCPVCNRSHSSRGYSDDTAYSSNGPFQVSCTACNTPLCTQLLRKMAGSCRIDNACIRHPPFLASCTACNTLVCHPLRQNVAGICGIDTACSSHQPLLVSCDACNARLCHPLLQTVAGPLLSPSPWQLRWMSPQCASQQSPCSADGI